MLLFTIVMIIASCQLQSNAPLGPTVRIPPKVEKTVVIEPEESANPLVGIWKSNRELTWASLNQIEDITGDSREYLKQNVFGLLTREFTDSETRTYFGSSQNAEKTSQFVPYRIIAATDAKIAIEHTDPLTEKITQSIFYFENDCYYELVSKYQYKEYFCRDHGEKKKFIAVPKSYKSQQIQQ